MIVVTGATGHLGRLALEALLKKVPARQLAGLARNPEKAQDLAARGVEIRRGDYGRPDTLAAALSGADKLLLVSSSEVGQRVAQHAAVIQAAKAAGVGLVAYTSILHADASRLALAAEHKATEALIRASGLPHVFLRNGWYLENYTEHLGPALQHGAIVGSAQGGRIAAAARADYAEAAAAVLTGTAEREVYELAGDRPFTMAELAAEVARQVGKPIAYVDLPPEKYLGVLTGAGLPGPYAEILVDADVQAARGDLDDGSGELRRLIGRPTTTLAAALGVGLGR